MCSQHINARSKDCQECLEYLQLVSTCTLMVSIVCSGSLEIKEFRIPGWNSTDGQNAQFMPYSRVNHAKYLVTEKRANIGTSNWQWGYFYTIAGMSLNTGDVAAVRTVQQIFDRDWSSAYATDL